MRLEVRGGFGRFCGFVGLRLLGDGRILAELTPACRVEAQGGGSTFRLILGALVLGLPCGRRLVLESGCACIKRIGREVRVPGRGKAEGLRLDG